MIFFVHRNPYADGKCPRCGFLVEPGATRCPMCSQKEERLGVNGVHIALIIIAVAVLIVWLGSSLGPIE